MVPEPARAVRTDTYTVSSGANRVVEAATVRSSFNERPSWMAVTRRASPDPQAARTSQTAASESWMFSLRITDEIVYRRTPTTGRDGARRRRSFRVHAPAVAWPRGHQTRWARWDLSPTIPG